MNKDSAVSWNWVEESWRQAEQESWAIGVDEFRKGNYRLALAHFQDAGGSPHVLFNIGVAHTKLQQYDEAETYFSEIVRDFARDDVLVALAMYMLGVVLQLQRNFHAAIQHYTRVFLEFLRERDVVVLNEHGLDFTIRKADLLFNRAICLAAGDSFTEALQDLKYTLELVQTEIDSRSGAGQGLPPTNGQSEKDLWAALGAAQELARRVRAAMEARGEKHVPRNAAIEQTGPQRHGIAASLPPPPNFARGHRLSSDSVDSVASDASRTLVEATPPESPLRRPAPASAPPSAGRPAAPLVRSAGPAPPPQSAPTDSPRRQLFQSQKAMTAVSSPAAPPVAAPPSSAPASSPASAPVSSPATAPAPAPSSSGPFARFGERLAAAISALASSASSPRAQPLSPQSAQSATSAPDSCPSSSHSIPQPSPPPMSLAEAAALPTPREDGARPPPPGPPPPPVSTEEASPRQHPRVRVSGIPRLNLASISSEGPPGKGAGPSGPASRTPDGPSSERQRAAAGPSAGAAAGAAAAGKSRGPGADSATSSPPSVLASASPSSSFSGSSTDSGELASARSQLSRPAGEAPSARSLAEPALPPVHLSNTPRADDRRFTDFFRPRKSPIRMSGSGVVRVPGGSVGLEELHGPPELELS